MPDIDLLIIGGGINGCGIARDAAGRGLSVMLVEQDDLASHTSASSTKLIHGGLRYLEQYAFRLVREALGERERLLRIAPHIIWPLRFVLPLGKGSLASTRPAWLIRLGLFLYDHIGGRRTLPGTQSIKLDGTGANTSIATPLRAGPTRAFAYSDCWVEDSRLVVLNAVDAAERGARVLTKTRLLSARREGRFWQVVLLDRETGEEYSVETRMIVNAAGPWVSDVLSGGLGRDTVSRTRLVKGSHIVVPRLYDGSHAYLLQNPDKRVIFVIPYESDFSLIGTTDTPFEGDAASVSISSEEIAYLCKAVGFWMKRDVSPSDIVWSFSGVRPLHDDGAQNASAVTRDYVLELDAPSEAAPVLSIYGGKITTYRRLAEAALHKLGVPGPSWTAEQPLPGGDIPNGDFDALVTGLCVAYPAIPDSLIRRLARAYGTRASLILAAPEVQRAELEYLYDAEFARDAEDVLWRRTKLGLHLSEAEKQQMVSVFAEVRKGRRAAR